MFEQDCHSHALVAHHVSVLRSLTTDTPEFRRSIGRLTTLVAASATADLATEPVDVVTPMGVAGCRRLSGDGVGLVPILRAGLGMVDPMSELIPEASVWHLGIYRNEATAEPVAYYDKLPEGRAPAIAFLLDPMLATGGSAEMSIDRLRQWGVGEIRLITIIAARPGVDRIERRFPEVRIFAAVVDPELDGSSYIVPGLGDAGDRIFGTD